LRSYGGIFDSSQKIDEYILSKKLNATFSNIISLLQKVETDGLIQYNPSTDDGFIQFLVPREDNYTINNISKSIKQRAHIKLEKAQAVLKYMNNTEQCRSKLLMSYFNDYDSEVCGICDVCMESQKKPKNENSKVILKKILLLIEEHNQLTSREIVSYLSTDKNIILEMLQHLLEKNKIAITSQNKFERIKND
jgi:ATP-dependent DNA helicase RecQ